jgi:glycosyltransferase 2 family protein
VAVSPRRVVSLLIAAAALIAVVVAAGDVRELGDRLGGFAWGAFALALLLSLGNYGIRFVRWVLYLRHLDLAVPTAPSLAVFLSGFALSVTPGKVGELVKSYLLREIRGIPVATTAPIVVAERLGDLLALLVLAGIGVASYRVAIEALIAGAVLITIGLVVLAWPRLFRALVDLVTAPQLTRRFRDRLHVFHDGIRVLVRPVPLTWSTALGVAAWACECIGFAVVLAGFPDTAVPLGLATLIYAATTIAGAVSFLPGGLGVTEGAMTLLLVESGGVDAATAVAATVLIRFATLWFAVGIGLVAMAIARRMTAGARDGEAILPS